jgi:hypothetical protein
MWIAVAQQRAEARIKFDQHQALLIDAMLDQRVGDRAGAGPQFDHRCGRLDVDILRHGAGQHTARRHHGAHVKRLLDPRAKETNFVVETKGFFQRTRGRLQGHVATRRGPQVGGGVRK